LPPPRGAKACTPAEWMHSTAGSFPLRWEAIKISVPVGNRCCGLQLLVAPGAARWLVGRGGPKPPRQMRQPRGRRREINPAWPRGRKPRQLRSPSQRRCHRNRDCTARARRLKRLGGPTAARKSPQAMPARPRKRAPRRTRWETRLRLRPDRNHLRRMKTPSESKLRGARKTAKSRPKLNARSPRSSSDRPRPLYLEPRILPPRSLRWTRRRRQRRPSICLCRRT